MASSSAHSIACGESSVLWKLALGMVMVSQTRVVESANANFVCVGMCTGAPLEAGTCCVGDDGEEQCEGGSMSFDGPVVFGGSRRLAQPVVISGDMKVCQDFVATSTSAAAAQPETILDDGAQFKCAGLCSGAPLAARTCCLGSDGEEQCEGGTMTFDDPVMFGISRRVTQPIVISGDMKVCQSLVSTSSVPGTTRELIGATGDGVHFTCVGACTGAPLAASECCKRADGEEQCQGGSMTFDQPVVFGGERRLSQFGMITGNMNICSGGSGFNAEPATAPSSSYVVNVSGGVYALGFGIIAALSCTLVACFVRNRPHSQAESSDEDIESCSNEE